MRARAVYRGYWTGGKRAGQVTRLHIIRDDSGTRSLAAGKLTLCGQGAYPVTHSDPVILDPMPDRPPEGLTWCPRCIGLLAERFGVLDLIAFDLAGYGDGPFDPHLTEAVWAKTAAETEAFRAERQERLAAAAR